MFDKRAVIPLSLLFLLIGLSSCEGYGSNLTPTYPVNPYCPDQTQLYEGCFRKCSHPDYDDCPDFYPLIYDPKFCGFYADGSYRSHTFACQACKGGALAVTDGRCSCHLEPCPPGEKCEQNVCVPDRCANCKLGETCLGG